MLTDHFAELSEAILQDNTKRVSIGAAVVLVALYFVYDKISRPPKHLRHIPYINKFSFFSSLLFKKQSIASFNNDYVEPLLRNKNLPQMQLRPGRAGWELFLLNPNPARKILYELDVWQKTTIEAGREGTVNIDQVGGPNILLYDGAVWEQHRRLVKPAFAQCKPGNHFGRSFLKLFEIIDKAGEKVDVVNLLDRTVLDAEGHAFMDFDFNALDNPDGTWFRIYANIRAGMHDAFFYLLPFLDQKMLWLFPKRKQVHKDIAQYAAMMVDLIDTKRLALKEKKGTQTADSEKSLLTLMLEAEMKGEGHLSTSEIKSDINIFFIAGHDTTTNSIAAALYSMAVHQDVQEKAREEVLRIFGNDPVDAIPQEEQLNQLNYLNLVIKESLRLYGPVTEILPRVAKVDTELDGVLIPKGTPVGMSIYGIHHSDRVWKDSKEFRCDRYLPGGEAESMSVNGWLPLSEGEHYCVGKNFNLTAQHVALSMFLTHRTTESALAFTLSRPNMEH
ncbi:hypothetical protein EC973_002014 [Apophysomyces ossiformis]|uniref:Cytochrome P450 n=1 Tax=Apophysomyces ossiformis TaxID=679940 RepID=A0A8H7BHA7_9FUNG|nr:hypothetical protein EC973_002014 [Apophysomyces ossiformis]